MKKDDRLRKMLKKNEEMYERNYKRRSKRARELENDLKKILKDDAMRRYCRYEEGIYKTDVVLRKKLGIYAEDPCYVTRCKYRESNHHCYESTSYKCRLFRACMSGVELLEKVSEDYPELGKEGYIRKRKNKYFVK